MFDRVHHVAFLTGDLDAATAAFEAQYGLEPLARHEMTGEFELEVALYPVGDALVELITPTTEAGWVYEHWQTHGDGFFHIAFAVDDIEAAIDDLQERGVGVEHDEPREGFDWLVANLDPADTIVPMQVVEDHRTPAERVEAFSPGDGQE